MARPFFINLLFAILLALISIYAQAQQLNTDRQRLLLQLSSTFYHVVRQNQVDLDSALMYASHSLNISRLALIDLNEDELIADAPKTDGNNDFQYLYKLLNQSKGTEHIQLLNLIGALFVFQPGNHPGDLDSARFYLQKGQKEAVVAGDSDDLCINLCYLGKYYFEKGKSQTADSCFTMAVTYCQKNGKNLNEAKAWDFWALYSPYPSYPLDKRINYCENALKSYRQLNEQEAEINVLTNLSYLQFAAGHVGESMTAIKEAFELEKKINFPYSHYSTDMMSLIYGQQGDNANYLSFALQSIRSVEATKDSFTYAHFCSRVADAYDQIGGKPNESLEWYLKSVDEYKKKGDQQMHLELMNANNVMIALGKDSEAVTLTQSLLREYPSVYPMDKQYHFLALGEGYYNLKEYTLADKYYKEAEKLQKEVERVSGNTFNKYMYYKVGHYYFTIKQFEKSKRYFMEVLNDKSPTGVLPVGIAQIHKELYSIDSAAGRTKEAIDHLKKYSDLWEALYTEKQSRQTEQLQIQFETEKKEKDLNLLRAKEQVQEKDLERTTQVRNYTYGMVAILIILMLVGYSRYRLKQKSNHQLQERQREIDKQNESLKYLLAEQQKLLEEKEWLVKEIHHRVKNNLQMVISLLNTQSKYLDNKEAIAAIGESRHRMQAMSLIHQKLYERENAACVNMQNYIRELAEYLKTSFNTNNGIYFDLQVKDIELDIAQAIPIGLILNEAITNAIKYAFRFIENGMISVIMKSYNDNTMLLEISDNGSGLPNDFDIDTSNSMGMRLIKGLVRQIDGTMLIENELGLKIRIEFQADTHLKSISREELLNDTGVFSSKVGGA